MADFRAEARSRGLWNVFLPGAHGAGLTNLRYAPIAEITGRSIQLAPAVLNCAAPDTGNMEVLAQFGADAQQKDWLKTDPSAERHRQQSMILIPRDTLGVEIKRGMHVLGYDDHDHGGHAEMSFTDVRVPASSPPPAC